MSVGKLVVKGFERLDLRSGLIAYDTETTGLNPYGNLKRWGYYPARPFVFSFCDSEGNGAFIRWPIDPFTRQVLTDKKSLNIVRSLLESPTITKITFNHSFDTKMSMFSGIKVRGNFQETMFLAHTVTGGVFKRYGLKPLAKELLNFPDDDEKELRKSAIEGRRKGKKLGWKISENVEEDYWTADPRLLEDYAVKDAERTMLLYLGMRDKLKENENFARVYRREKKLFPVVFDMETSGVKVDPERIKILEKFYEDYKRKQLKIAEKHGGKDMNFRSAPQKVEFFFNKKKYQPLRRGKKYPRTDGDTLIYICNRYKDKLAKAILEYNAAEHMLSGFIRPYNYFKVEEKEGWIIHPNFRQVGTITGRLSGSDPNPMQVPDPDSGRRKAEIGMRIREIFVPRKGFYWYLPDYSQIEVWVYAFLSQDKIMMRALLSGEDFHSQIAKIVWGEEKDYEERKGHWRKCAKLLMFCKLYGGGTAKVALLMGSSHDEAQEFIDDYDEKLPGVREYMDRMINLVYTQKKIVNPFGRTYYIPTDKAYRAVNYMVQGTSADILKRAMIRISKMFRERKEWKDNKIRIPIHDELAIEISKKSHSNELMRAVVKAMQSDSKKIGCPVPLPVGMKIAKERWSEYEEIPFIKEEWKEKFICSNNAQK